MEVALEDLGRLRCVEAGGVVTGAAGDRALDGAGGEGLGPPLGDLGFHTAGDRVPDQLVGPPTPATTRRPARTGPGPRTAGPRGNVR